MKHKTPKNHSPRKIRLRNGSTILVSKSKNKIRGFSDKILKSNIQSQETPEKHSKEPTRILGFPQETIKDGNLKPAVVSSVGNHVNSQDEQVRKRKLDGTSNRVTGYTLKSKSNKRDGSPDTLRGDDEISKEVLRNADKGAIYPKEWKIQGILLRVALDAIALTKKKFLLGWHKESLKKEIMQDDRT